MSILTFHNAAELFLVLAAYLRYSDVEQGENPKVLQEILDHSQITHTIDTYFPVIRNMWRTTFGGVETRGPDRW